ncbi:hypothetical protein MO867_03610 [Microbulbifer sp. OS29]|uniref:Uncharacterized protein n=1 Tax=Microbulbifer okhotskensis TaxID=2926617 RepID=A0A9X2J5B8_9GAMM|nr:hypothetical protein [Microbulbifer okhotskensis]MCO1333420.1 hypothetical protein [Microbulbifer okhotskensis]
MSGHCFLKFDFPVPLHHKSASLLPLDLTGSKGTLKKEHLPILLLPAGPIFLWYFGIDLRKEWFFGKAKVEMLNRENIFHGAFHMLGASDFRGVYERQIAPPVYDHPNRNLWFPGKPAEIQR